MNLARESRSLGARSETKGRKGRRGAGGQDFSPPIEIAKGMYF